MPIDFNFENVAGVEFGIGIDEEVGQRFYFVPTDPSVHTALPEMAVATRDAMNAINVRRYEPSEKHGGEEPLYLPLNDVLASGVRSLHEASNLATNSGALSETEKMFCYFAYFRDTAGRKLTAVRRAIQFKGILKSHLLSFVTDALKLVADKVFKLDKDFDFLVDSTNVHILRPSGFEFVGKLQAAVLEAVPGNVEAIRTELGFVDFELIKSYAGKHPRAARYLASILSQPIKNISRSKLRTLCRANSVAVESKNGKVIISPGYEMAFLEVLDRRRYELELVEGFPERYRATSRSKVQ